MMRRPFPLPSDILGKVRPRHEAILRQARLAIGTAREAELKRSHDAAVKERARNIVERAKEEKRLRYGAENAARRALLVIEQAYDRIVAASDEIDRARWKERQGRVERELRKIITGGRP
jgi:hypothetical protein